MGKPVIIITPGDPSGVGPEIVAKALRSREISRLADFVVIGAEEPFRSGRLGKFDKKAARFIAAPRAAPNGGFLPGYQSGWSIQKAVQLLSSGEALALVTGPISKDRLQKGGFPYPGHTEFLAKLSNAPETTMMLANDQLRVSLVTTHLPLSEVPKTVSRESIRRAVLQTQSALRDLWKIRKPRIAVCALNPHAGESGLLGDEEQQIITPEILSLKTALEPKAVIEGPFPSDTLFALHLSRPKRARWDAVVAMYHDQGLMPVKLLDFPNTVNISLGLPFIRTSVDHGTGFDIAGKGIADPSSLKAAIRLAARLVRAKR